MSLAQKIDAFHKANNHTKIEAVIFENSIDCLYYGYGFPYVNIWDYDKDLAFEIYEQARQFLGDNE